MDTSRLPAALAGKFNSGAGCASGYVTLNPGGNSTSVTPANYHCYGNSDKYNYASVNLIMTPQERTGGFVSGDYRLGEHVTAYMDAVYEKTSANFQLAPAIYGTGTGVVVAQDNAFNTFGRTFQTPIEKTDLKFGSRLTSAGNRAAFTGRQDAQINTGFRGDFTIADKNWNWDVGYNYGHQSTSITTMGLIDQTKLYTGSSTLNANGTATCPTGVDAVACQFNPFDNHSGR